VIRDFNIDAQSIPEGASIGSPLAVRLAGNDSEGTLAEVQSGEWALAPADEAGAVQRGEFHLGIIPRRITGASEFY
jgi:hypothetical protein